MPRHALNLALGLIIAAAAAAAINAAGAGAHPAQDASPCTTERAMSAAPPGVTVGETVAVSLTAVTGCPADDVGPLHIVLVIQASASMGNDSETGIHPRRDIQAAVGPWLDRLKLAERPWIKVGIVEFNDSPNRLCELSNDTEAVKGCLGKLRATGLAYFNTGIKEGYNTLKRGRPPAAQRAGLREILVVIGDGTNDYIDPRTPRPPLAAAPLQGGGCEPVKAEADAIKAESPDALIVGICAGGCDSLCMRQVATSTGFVFELARFDRFESVIDRQIDQLTGAPLKQITVTHVLPEAFGLVADSAIPAPVSTDGGRLVWEFHGASADDIAIAFELFALADGSHAVCQTSTGDLVDAKDRTASFDFDCPTIAVEPGEAPPTATATATAEAEPATSTPSPSHTPATPGATPAAAIYLPAAVSQAGLE